MKERIIVLNRILTPASAIMVFFLLGSCKKGVFGIGTTFYSKKSSNTFLLMGGVKYTSFKETLNDPDNNKISSAINSIGPDYGIMYNLKKV